MTHANRGMGLEMLINHTNTIYMQRNMAVVHKRPTPIKILRSSGTKILSAVLESQSTVDYEGCYQGHSLQFEAKSTKEGKRFDLKNFHQHQIEHMRRCLEQGALTFVIMEFTKHREVYFVHANMVIKAWDAHKRGGAASIPYEDISITCELIKPTRGVPIDYLAVVDKLIASQSVQGA